MFARLGRRALRPAGQLQLVRGYAEAVEQSKLRLSLVLPHETLFSSHEVTQVNVPATSGDMGVLAGHVPAIEQLKPGIVEVIESSGASRSFFVSGGFAVMQPNSQLCVNAVEAFALEDFSADAIKSNLADAVRRQGQGGEEEKVEASIEVEVLEALQAALSK
jgi:F-type H+-transporting ATPase subunit delta